MGKPTKLNTFVKAAVWKLSPRLYRTIFSSYHGQIYAIATLKSRARSGFPQCQLPAQPALTRDAVRDIPGSFVADPFMLYRDGQWHMFFEVMSELSRQGVISLATSHDAITWEYQQVVLQEPFHLAYPCVVSEGDNVYMIPDTPGQGVRLYRSENFPLQWVYEKTLVDGQHFSDPTVFRHDNRWWMFVASNQHTEDEYQYDLYLYSADTLSGTWHSHPQNPVVRDAKNYVRPGGSVVHHEGALYRLGQDCETDYGKAVYAIQIAQLDRDHYREHEEYKPVLLPTGQDWCRDGVHHLNAHNLGDEVVACVDGWHWRKR